MHYMYMTTDFNHLTNLPLEHRQIDRHTHTYIQRQSLMAKQSSFARYKTINQNVYWHMVSLCQYSRGGCHKYADSTSDMSKTVVLNCCLLTFLYYNYVEIYTQLTKCIRPKNIKNNMQNNVGHQDAWCHGLIYKWTHGQTSSVLFANIHIQPNTSKKVLS